MLELRLFHGDLSRRRGVALCENINFPTRIFNAVTGRFFHRFLLLPPRENIILLKVRKIPFNCPSTAKYIGFHAILRARDCFPLSAVLRDHDGL